MAYYQEFDPYFLRERHKELLREAEHQRLVGEAWKKARENRKARSGVSNVTASRRFSPSSWKDGDRSYWIVQARSRMKKALGRASTSEGNDEHTKEKLAALLSASALKVLDAACALYVLGSSGEEREARGREHHAVGAPGSGRRA